MARKKPPRRPLAKKSLLGARKSVINKRRKGFLAVFVPWMQRFGIALGVVTFVVWGSAWLWLNGSIQRGAEFIENKIELAGRDMGFQLENIIVKGRTHTDPEILLAILNIQKGDPLLTFEPHAAREQIERIGWVSSAHVERRFPDTIYIDLKERVPSAVWKDGAAMKLLDEQGEVIPTASMKPFKDLLIVQGEGAPENMPKLVALLDAEPQIKENILAATYISERRWDLVFKGGIKAQLPEQDVGLALRRLAQAQEESSLLDGNIQSVDLREIDRISIRTKPGQVQEYKASLKIKAGNPI